MPHPNITKLTAGHLRFNLGYIYKLSSDHPANGEVAIVPIYCYHIALPGRSVLVDAPLYDAELISDSMIIPDYSPPEPIAAQLANHGISLKDITDVIITHCHFDHFNAITQLENGRYTPTFPDARHYLGAADYQPDDFDDVEETTLPVVYDAGLLTLVDAETNIGDGLTIVPKPGETLGHQILVLDDGRRKTYFTGDLYHHQFEFGEVEANVFWARKKLMNDSKQSFLEETADTDSHIYFAHIPGPYQVKNTGDGFEWYPAIS
jgi:glyoxylase-like metal-dependent hydrolase (beta-lactamase superfamily II)